MAMLIDEISTQFALLSELFHFLQKYGLSLVTYVTKCMADAILKTVSIKHKKT